jgi:release factor glutamine methyltransferase
LRVKDLLKETIQKFKEKGITSPVIDAEIIISHSLNIERYQLVTDNFRNLTSEELKSITKKIQRRLKFEPVAYIIKEKEFYSLNFFVNKNVLIPRPETELLIELGIYYSESNTKLLDLCTGSGAIAISLKYNRPDIEIYASDISKKAIYVAKKNSSSILGNNAIKFFTGDLFEPFENIKFDVIISNPPYVDPNIIDQLQKDLSFEPEIALFSGNNGKSHIEQIISSSKKYLTKKGILLLEISGEMKDFIKEKGEKENFLVSILSDYAGIPRVAILKTT